MHKNTGNGDACLGCLLNGTIVASLIGIIAILGFGFLSQAVRVTEASNVSVEVAQAEVVKEPTIVPPTATPLPPTAMSIPPSPTLQPTAQQVASAPTTGDTGASGYDPVAVAKGRELFMICSACHGADAKGLPNLGKNLVDSEFVHSLTDDELLEFVKTGRPMWDPLNTTGIDMPPKGGNPALTDDDIKNIIAYIRSLSAGG